MRWRWRREGLFCTSSESKEREAGREVRRCAGARIQLDLPFLQTDEGRGRVVRWGESTMDLCGGLNWRGAAGSRALGHKSFVLARF